MIRRVVTGHREGKAVFLADSEPPGMFVSQTTPGLVNATVWATTTSPVIEARGVAEAVGSATTLLPPVGQTRLVYLVLPPLAVMMSDTFDGAAAAAEFAAAQPEMAALVETDNPGMHRTETIDYVIVLEGEIWLELDDGERTLLKPKDVVVQAGTRHAWRNLSEEPVTLAVTLVGATRE